LKISFAATEDPGGDIARARMTLVYGQEASDAFFALLNNTIVLDVSYTHPAAALEAVITEADANLAYDGFVIVCHRPGCWMPPHREISRHSRE